MPNKTLFPHNDKIGVMRNYLDQVTLYKYVLRCIYNEICSKCGQCDACDNLEYIKRRFDKLLEEAELTIKLDISDSKNP